MKKSSWLILICVLVVSWGMAPALFAGKSRPASAKAWRTLKQEKINTLKCTRVQSSDMVRVNLRDLKKALEKAGITEKVTIGLQVGNETLNLGSFKPNFAMSGIGGQNRPIGGGGGTTMAPGAASRQGYAMRSGRGDDGGGRGRGREGTVSPAFSSRQGYAMRSGRGDDGGGRGRGRDGAMSPTVSPGQSHAMEPPEEEDGGNPLFSKMTSVSVNMGSVMGGCKGTCFGNLIIKNSLGVEKARFTVPLAGLN